MGNIIKVDFGNKSREKPVDADALEVVSSRVQAVSNNLTNVHRILLQEQPVLHLVQTGEALQPQQIEQQPVIAPIEATSTDLEQAKRQAVEEIYREQRSATTNAEFESDAA